MNWSMETPRLLLRAADRTDAHNLYDLNSDPAVMTFLPGEDATLDGIQKIVPLIAERNERYHNQLGLFMAFESATNEFIGWFILRPDRKTPEDTKNLEIGYRLKRRYWGMGYGTEASLALVERARSQFGARRIYAEAMTGNHASIRIMEKIGLSLEKTFEEVEKDGTTRGLVLYSRSFEEK